MAGLEEAHEHLHCPSSSTTPRTHHHHTRVGALFWNQSAFLVEPAYRARFVQGGEVAQFQEDGAAHGGVTVCVLARTVGWAKQSMSTILRLLQVSMVMGTARSAFAHRAVPDPDLARLRKGHGASRALFVWAGEEAAQLEAE